MLKHGDPQSIFNHPTSPFLRDKKHSLFTKQLGVEFYEDYIELRKEREIIKSWRDQILSHNDSNSKVENINFQDTEKLLNLGWKVVSIFEWAYLSTVYGIDGKYTIREDIQRQRLRLKNFLQKTLNSA